ncbi:MAG: aspartyl-phosphate phosphatase Spo0E family protein [Alicyclobacillus sp.]|nr:aspartyl-phosphate phosphatase Spo0E family protein [Alicyclobacillus sp.]
MEDATVRKIESLRQLMYQLAEQARGDLTDPTLLKVSQALDRELNKLLWKTRNQPPSFHSAAV